MTPIDTEQPVGLHDLSIRQEGAEWIVGRVETGVFVALPGIAVEIIERLRLGDSPASIAGSVRSETGEEVDVADFVAALVRLGFVAQLEGRPISGQTVRRATFPRVRPQQVRWLLHPGCGLAVIALALAALALTVANPSVTPSVREVVWSERGSLVVLSQAVAGWGSVLLHELAHLFTARAVGVPGRMSFGTRLQFLVAQTDVSGVWSKPRRTRMAVYLSGMALNLTLACVGIFLAHVFTSGPGRAVAAILVIGQIGMIASQFMFFMRTDVYFVIQDLVKCKNLYGDATDYARYILRRVFGRAFGENPLRALPVRERRIVQIYSALFVPASALSVSLFLFISIPILTQLLGNAFSHLLAFESLTGVVDASIVIGLVLTGQTLWARAWWRRHGVKVRAFLARFRR